MSFSIRKVYYLCYDTTGVMSGPCKVGPRFQNVCATRLNGSVCVYHMNVVRVLVDFVQFCAAMQQSLFSYFMVWQPIYVGSVYIAMYTRES